MPQGWLMMESCWDLLLGLLRFPYFNYVPNLEAWFSILPEGNCLPSTYKEAYRVNQPNLVSELVHACQNDCVMFRGEFENSVPCPKCHQLRCKAGKANVPQRIFYNLPLGPCLSWSFGTKGISYLQSHGGSANQQKWQESWMTFMIHQCGKSISMRVVYFMGIHKALLSLCALI